MKTLRVVLVALTLASGAMSMAASDFVLIVNPSSGVSTLSKAEVKDIFLRLKTTWSDGSKIVPVDQTATAPIRVSFTTFIHGRSVDAIKSYWRQQIFSGREVPPVEKDDDSSVTAFVKANHGAIGYVSATAGSIPGVKVIALK